MDSKVATEPQPVLGKDVILKEFKPLSHLHNLIPRKAQKGIKNIDIELTCIDVNKNYIGLGSNIGLVFLYDRKQQQLTKLKCESGNHHVTTVKLLCCLDDLVAAGTSNGHLSIFQLPSRLPGHHTELQRYSLDKLHDCAITCAEWSANGMKLYTGDERGKVIYTSVDFYQRQVCQSYQILTEGSTITQLSYRYKTLLVSNLQRSVLCYTDESNKLTQVGQQPRKSDGPFGACFIHDVCKTSDAELYAARPNNRIWKASVDGSVKQTYLLKKLIAQEHPKIDLLSDTPVAIRPVEGLQQFGHVFQYNEKHLLTWSDNRLYVYDPTEQVIIGSVQDNIGNIISVATYEDEIFILRSKDVDRPVIRLATKPEVKWYQKLEEISVDRVSSSPSTGIIESLSQMRLPSAAVDLVRKSRSQDDSKINVSKVLSAFKLTRSRSSEDLKQSEDETTSMKWLNKIIPIKSRNKQATEKEEINEVDPKTPTSQLSAEMITSQVKSTGTDNIDCNTKYDVVPEAMATGVVPLKFTGTDDTDSNAKCDNVSGTTETQVAPQMEFTEINSDITYEALNDPSRTIGFNDTDKSEVTEHDQGTEYSTADVSDTAVYGSVSGALYTEKELEDTTIYNAGVLGINSRIFDSLNVHELSTDNVEERQPSARPPPPISGDIVFTKPKKKKVPTATLR